MVGRFGNLAIPLWHLLCCWQVPRAALMQFEPQEAASLMPPANWFSPTEFSEKPLLISDEVHKRDLTHFSKVSQV